MSSFTDNVLSSIKDEDLRKALKLDKRGKSSSSQVDWIKEGLCNIQHVPEEIGCQTAYSEEKDDKPLQQIDLLRRFYMTIATDGLYCAYITYKGKLPPIKLPNARAGRKRKRDQSETPNIPTDPVIIVGAGMSGLVAAYELTKAGYNVQILEMSERFGGRVKTLDQKDGFDRGLHVDAGAMRIPLPPPLPPLPDKNNQLIHYLTDYYALSFGLTPVPFKNADSNAFYNFYGECTKISDWKPSQFSKYWPGWDARLKATGQSKYVSGIDLYYQKTTNVVTQLLRNRLNGANDACEQIKQWDCWTRNWCQFSLESFLRNSLEGIKSRLEFDDKLTENIALLDELDLYLPWPEIAITGYCVWEYTLSPDVSLVAAVQEGMHMGHWWSKKMHSYHGGLSEIPKAFAAAKPAKPAKPGDKTVEEMITYNRTVTKVEYKWTSNAEKSVIVSGVITSSSHPIQTFSVTGRSVILTVPLHVLRGIEIVNTNPNDTSFPREFQQAIQDITYTPSTKIMLQYKEQFWNTGKDSKTDITGGFSKTNMPIGQLHYPTEVIIDANGDWIPKPVTKDEKGILMVYTWKAEALLWGALEKRQAIMLAVNQIERIHPNSSKLFEAGHFQIDKLHQHDTKDYCEVGRRQAWASDPTTLGAFAMLRPKEYISVLYLMQHSWRNVYFAGEAISLANGWIQGALGSGLRAAYQLFSDDQLNIGPKN